MSLRFILLALLLSQTALAGTKACGGAQVGFWTNPDGSRGGMVASTAKAFTGAIIAPEAQVCDYAQIQSGAKLLDRATLAGRAQLLPGGEVGGSARVEGEAKVGGSVNIPTKISGEVVVSGSPLITGRTNISQKAKVSGSAKVHNSIICQASLIEGIEVIESDYYCQTDDPEPAHPGEAGTKTLLGVDVDRDGVRDDIEIWINQKFSNTAEKDMYNLRQVFKLQAIQNNESLKWASDKQKSREISKKKMDLVDCMLELSRSTSKDITIKLKALDVVEDSLDEFKVNIMNTRDRIKAHSRYLSNLHGTVLKGTGNKDICGFEVRK
ncbi:MAG: hypothetical protein LW878_08890 [Proteobacteria bacterium]|nr:hypothetical protein [Pseudomonadota bacterium]